MLGIPEQEGRLEVPSKIKIKSSSKLLSGHFTKSYKKQIPGGMHRRGMNQNI